MPHRRSVGGAWQAGGVQEARVDVVARLRQAGVTRGDLVGLAVAPDVALGLATEAGAWAVPPGTDLVAEVGR
jgi:hypothetical protein